MHSAPVSKIVWIVALEMMVAGCGGAAAPPAPRVAVVPASTPPAALAPTIAWPSEHWYFESLSQDGQRALIRRLDGPARGTLQTRVVDVDSGATLAEDTFPELGRLPAATLGRRPSETAELVGMLAAPAFGDDLVRGARLAGQFPFGSWGRLSASPTGSTMAFNAGDWLYLADKGGHVQRRLTSEAAYDPRFTPDGKHLIFRRANGMLDKASAKYELFVVPADGSAPPRVLGGTAGARDRFAIDAEGKAAVAVASQDPHIRTCVLSIAMKPPFAVKNFSAAPPASPLGLSFVPVTVTSTASPGRAILGDTLTRVSAAALAPRTNIGTSSAETSLKDISPMYSTPRPPSWRGEPPPPTATLVTLSGSRQAAGSRRRISATRERMSCGVNGLSTCRFAVDARKSRARALNAPPVMNTIRAACSRFAAATLSYRSTPDMLGIMTSDKMRS